ncbi:GNAT family N-acetyltransferase [Caldalkalibacillus salinus]|uniref:GNAT family N-acetyltransferase n=1 Tax=Caldalkalibacillus salinus TaxID=2803787 RepID=UPI00235175FF|nr:GNAT family N-acetyltransferase [Caldalkalibacillus salinus]
MVQIREFKMSDLKDVVGLMEDLGYPTNLQEMQCRMENILALSMYSTFVAEENDKVVGMIGLRELYIYEESKPFVQISLLVTSKEERGKGIGKSLINKAEEWGVNRGASTMFLTSGIKPEREAAHSFYKSQGFEINGYRFTKQLKED